MNKISFKVTGVQSVDVTIAPEFKGLVTVESIADMLSAGELLHKENQITTLGGDVVALFTEYEFAGIRKDYEAFEV